MFFFIFSVISVVINSTCGFLFTYGDGVGDKFIGTNVANPIQFLVFTIGFQWMIAYIASAIVSGAVAERCKYIAHFISTVFITGMLLLSCLFFFIFKGYFYHHLKF